jgi:nucleotide-binding universal stress UspA family protein
MADVADAGQAGRKRLEEVLMASSIICGVDDSDSAKGAARVARELSARLGLRLVFVRVVERGAGDDEIGVVAARLHHLADSATEVDCGAHWHVDVGHPADRLVAVAEDEDAALIVVGSTGPRSSLLGSISADVSRRAPCPVVVVAPGADGSLVNASEAASRFDDASVVSGSIRVSADARAENEADHIDDRDFAGGIVRFSLSAGGKR